MIATTELGKIFRAGCIDNSQVSCLADSLVDFVDETFAARFVNKSLEDSDIVAVTSFPKTFAVEKFQEVNRFWRQQSWRAKHRLSDGNATTGVVPAARANAGYSSPVPSAQINSLVAKNNALEDRARKAEAELSVVAEELMKAHATLMSLQSENMALDKDLTSMTKDLEVMSKSLETTQGQLEDEKRKTFDLLAEIAKNEALLDSLRTVFPEEIVTLGVRFSRLLPPTINARRLNYLYLSLVSAQPIDDSSFNGRFKLFDDELYALFKSDANELSRAREMFAADLNPRMTRIQVSWDFIGQPFDAERFSTSDSFGTEVTEVISALITKANGSVVRRAKVKTEIS